MEDYRKKSRLARTLSQCYDSQHVVTMLANLVVLVAAKAAPAKEDSEGTLHYSRTSLFTTLALCVAIEH